MTDWTKPDAYGTDALARKMHDVRIRALSIWYDLYNLTGDLAMGTVADAWDMPSAWAIAEGLIDEITDGRKQRKAQNLLYQVRRLYDEYSELQGVYE
jgi:hypothetical protein